MQKTRMHMRMCASCAELQAACRACMLCLGVLARMLQQGKAALIRHCMLSMIAQHARWVTCTNAARCSEHTIALTCSCCSGMRSAHISMPHAGNPCQPSTASRSLWSVPERIGAHAAMSSDVNKLKINNICLMLRAPTVV